MNDEVVVYSARPEHVLRAAALLGHGGIEHRIVQGSHVGMPWVRLSLPSHELVVPARLADRARQLLQPLAGVEAGAIGRSAPAVRRRLGLLGLAAIGYVACMMAVIDGVRFAGYGALVCFVLLVVAFCSLRRLKPARTRSEPRPHDAP